jgi:phosphohistidine phosphatase
MNLILWRHAQAVPAVDDQPDTERPLTPLGVLQARHVGGWIDARLPADAAVVVSPALRCVQTASYLSRSFKEKKYLSLSSNADNIIRELRLDEVSRRTNNTTVCIVGHQPWLGELIGSLCDLPRRGLKVRKASVWWLKAQPEKSTVKFSIYSVIDPGLLSAHLEPGATIEED